MKRVASGILPFIAVDRRARKALHRQIYDAYREAIIGGRLRLRQRILSSRGLASELGVSRFPVLNAYAQLLAEGYLESRVGAGTVVSSSLPEQLISCASAGVQYATSRSGPRPVVRRSFRPGGSLRRPGCGVGEHSVSARLLSISSQSTSGPAWLHAGAEAWAPSRFTTAMRWVSRLSGKHLPAT
jgi:DNA-binding transcriptional MocR family regulator